MSDQLIWLWKHKLLTTKRNKLNVYYTGDFRRKRDRSHVCLYRRPHIHHLYWYKNHLKVSEKKFRTITIRTANMCGHDSVELKFRGIFVPQKYQDELRNLWRWTHRYQFWAHSISVTPPLFFIKGPIPKQLGGLDFSSVSMVFLLEFGTAQMMCYFLLFILSVFFINIQL